MALDVRNVILIIRQFDEASVLIGGGGLKQLLGFESWLLGAYAMSRRAPIRFVTSVCPYISSRLPLDRFR